MKLRILHHDHCFDGFASAAVFSRFFSEKIRPDAEISYTGLAHKPSQKLIEEELFDGDENAIVDFKYSPSPRLTWWFDHHQSAFLSPEDEKHFRSGTWPAKFYDPNYKSCTKFIADTVAAKYGFDQTSLGELIYWADIIDGPIRRRQDRSRAERSALQLMLVIEASRDPVVMRRIIEGMQTQSLGNHRGACGRS
jgi:hypothetical protein